MYQYNKVRSEQQSRARLGEQRVANWFSRLEGVEDIEILEDYGYSNRSIESIQGHKDNMLNRLGIDLIVKYRYWYLNIDIKTFTYNSKHYGEIDSEGRVGSLLVQVEDRFKGEGWGLTDKLTHRLAIYILGKGLYVFDRLEFTSTVRKYLDQVEAKDIIEFRKGRSQLRDNIEKCIRIPLSQFNITRYVPEHELVKAEC